MNLKKITFVAFILSFIILLLKFSVSSFGNDLFFWLWLDMDLRIFDLPIWFEIYGPSILSILQFLPLIPFLYVFYKRQNRPPLNINKRSVILVLLSVVVLAGIIFTGNYINQKHTYDSMISNADSAMAKENYSEAISLYESSLLIKQVPGVTNSIQLAKGLVVDKSNYDEANTKMECKQYLEAIGQFSKALEYKDASQKLDQCKANYIADNLKKASEDASSEKYDLALTSLENILKLDPSNSDAEKLKTEYTTSLTQQQEVAIANKAVAKTPIVTKPPTVAINSEKRISSEEAVALVLKIKFNNRSEYVAGSSGTDVNKGRTCYVVRASNLESIKAGGNGSAGIFAVDVSTGLIWEWKYEG